MSLTVEVAGYGLCQTSQPYSVYVVCVQQENFQAWNVYRRYTSFVELSQQVKALYPDTVDLPTVDGESLNFEALDQLRSALDKWLRSVINNLMILRTQSMYQFLCADANMPPPYLEIHWRNSENGTFDEMDMDDMFEGKDEDDTVDDEEDDDDLNSPRLGSTNSSNTNSNVFGIIGSCNQHISKKKYRKDLVPEEQNDDGMDIKSLSLVEAEFLYDRVDVTDASEHKKIISLESFHIIKVIGLSLSLSLFLSFSFSLSFSLACLLACLLAVFLFFPFTRFHQGRDRLVKYFLSERDQPVKYMP